MTNRPSDSSQPEKQRRENEKHTVTRIVDENFRHSPESVERLRKLDELPDSKIRTDLVPELSPEAWRGACKNPYLNLLHGQTRRKAS